MDFHGAGAGAALAALAFFAGDAAGACTALDGTYNVESAEKTEGMARSLTELAADKERGKLFKREGPPPQPQGLGGGAPRARPKVTPLSASVRIKTSTESTQLSFLDAQNKVLSQAAIGAVPARWKCVSGRLERRFETTGGLGDNIRTEKTEQVLFATPDGDLHLAETVTLVAKAPPAPRKVEVRFKRLAKP